MSRNRQHNSGGSDVLDVESGLEALRSSPSFRGPVESFDGHDSNDHLALIHETREEQFAAVVPFLREGLERGERCLYLVDDTSREEVTAALRAGGVDVDAALDSGALSFHTVEETYLRNGRFEPDEMIEFYGEFIEDATEEYGALRVSAETGWLLDETTTIERFMEYESKINHLFEGEDCTALCQYDRTQVPPEYVRDIVRTHPHLVYDGTVSHNFYYTPPEQFFGPDEPAREVDRMLNTLVDRTTAKVALQEREEFLRQLYEVTADGDRSFEAKLTDVLALGCEWFGVDLGALNRVDTDADRLEIEYAVGDHSHFDVGVELPLSDTYCQAVADIKEATSISNPVEEGFADVLVYEEYGVGGCLGTYIPVDGGVDRTLAFVPDGSQVEPFTEEDRTYLELMGQWVGYELNRRRREQFLRECYEVTSDPTRSFEEKFERLVEVGCERFDLDHGGLCRVDPDSDFLEVERVVGDHDVLAPGLQADLSETYCQVSATASATSADAVSEPVDVTDPERFEGKLCYDEFGIRAYLGTHLELDGAPNRTFWFLSDEPRDKPITDEDRTFHRLMGQWVKYELEHRQRVQSLRECYEITSEPDCSFEEKVERLLELGCERFGLEMAGLHRLPSWDGGFRLERGVGLGVEPGDETLWTDPGEGHFCRQAVSADAPVGMADVRGTDWESDQIHQQFGVASYLGTTVASARTPYGTLWFGSTEPRDREFSEAERTFIELMGQWIGYEIERAEHEDRLHALNALARELMDAESVTAMSEAIAEAAAGALDLPIAAIAHYDEGNGVLEPVARTDAAADLVDVTSILAVDGTGWQAFVEGDTQRIADLPGDGSSVTEVAVLPLGNHGVLLAGSIAADGFEPTDLDFAETVAANVRAAFDRADRERKLHDREATLEEQNEALERLNRVNDIIRSIDRALVSASSRGEIESVVCEKLADEGPYELAWVGEYDAVTDELPPREWAGAERGYLDEIRVTTGDGPEGQGPAGRAVRTGEPQVVNDILEDTSFQPWRQAALKRGYHAGVALPLCYHDTTYGVLCVYADRPGVFDDLERSVLAELSDTIAYAINAAESKKTLVSDEVTELEFEIRDDFAPAAVTTELDCSIALENVVPQSDGGLRLFISTRGVPASAFTDAAGRLPVEDLTLVSEHEADGEQVCLFHAWPADGNLCAAVVEHGGVPRSITVSEGSATLLVDLAADRDVRELVSMFRARYPSVELVAHRSREQSRRTPTGTRAALTDDLTDRQLEVLQTAFFSGYFETPRTQTGSEVAETLGVSQPTFNTHLRAANRKLCGLLFEDGATLDPAADRE